MASDHFDWRLTRGIASACNSCLLLVVLLSFPLVLHWTGALRVAEISPHGPEHTRVFIKTCLTLIVFLWVCFGIALFGIRSRGTITWRELIAARWSRWQDVMRDLGVALATLLVMMVIGNLSNAWLGRLQQDNAALRAMFSPQSALEALASLAAALTAGFVEEFVFRGYVQRQCEALLGNALLASVLQVVIFTQGHFYQGWIRLVPVLLIGSLLTIVALWRRSLAPGMIAHGLGDGLVAFSYFVK